MCTWPPGSSRETPGARPVIEQRGRVISLDGGDAWVRVGGQSGCPTCDSGQGCGAGLFGRLLRRSAPEVRVVNHLQVRPGQPVVLGIPEHAYLSLVMRLYGWPLLAGVAGAWFGHALAAPRAGGSVPILDLAAAAGGLLAAGIVLSLLRRSLPQRFTRLSPELLQSEHNLDCLVEDRHP